MTIDRVKGDIVFTCDTCPDALETCTNKFNDGSMDSAHNQLVRAGWRAYQFAGEWRHTCKLCDDTKGAKQRVNNHDK